MTETETFETIRYTADTALFSESGHVLLIERDWPPYEGHWALPGGHVDAGETSRAAAARELTEETGIHLDPDTLTQAGVFDDPARDPRGRYVTVVYTAVVPEPLPPTAGDDARAAAWHPLTDLPDLAFDHGHILHTIRNDTVFGKKKAESGPAADPWTSTQPWPTTPPRPPWTCPHCGEDNDDAFAICPADGTRRP